MANFKCVYTAYSGVTAFLNSAVFFTINLSPDVDAGQYDGVQPGYDLIAARLKQICTFFSWPAVACA